MGTGVDFVGDGDQGQKSCNDGSVVWLDGRRGAVQVPVLLMSNHDRVHARGRIGSSSLSVNRHPDSDGPQLGSTSITLPPYSSLANANKWDISHQPICREVASTSHHHHRNV
ncbi:hypothetical protein GALMADRAFT_230098 [Galerina marginata CBS 339.88]|uniref:Uncharacterized protein n=1 Tax=Galerina marginata (strain CBS 339.88) TaxID=685588 RepID=A0A067SKG3_GALM3|nr:hypothetical protein GALMADRAFT_230098 [Galerina marginata CBS 339.88]